jgi:hypothetical protein
MNPTATDDLEPHALKAALAAAQSRLIESEDKLAVTSSELAEERARHAGDQALIAHMKLVIAKLALQMRKAHLNFAPQSGGLLKVGRAGKPGDMLAYCFMRIDRQHASNTGCAVWLE